MSSGPSKQELEMYWQNSRQYFDELAEHYLKTDPEYYKENIAPFYSNPFRSSTSYPSLTDINTQTGRRRKSLPVMIALSVLVTGASAGIFLLMDKGTGKEDKSRSVEKNITQYEDKTDDDKETEDVSEPPETEEPSIHYRRGLDLYNKKKYDMAEKYLKYVPPGDPDYEEAGRMLQDIKIKTELEGKNQRKKPIERMP